MGETPPPRHVISIRRYTGLGDHLICLAAAWRFARDTGRALVADWRFSPYTLAAKANLFPSCFEVPPVLAGVPFFAANDLGALGPDIEPGTHGRLLLPIPPSAQRPSHSSAVAHIRGGRDLPVQTVIFDSCVNHGITRIADLWDFFSALRPVASAMAALTAFRAGLPAGPLIGLHIRHGNGAAIEGYAPHWQSFPAAIDRCLEAASEARSRLGPNAIVLLCTDSPEVEAAIRARIPDLVTRRKLLRDGGEGELHLWRGAALVREDALVEMLLLAECDALIRYPPASFFSFYGAVMQHGRGRDQTLIDILQKPWDASDPLSPALLFSSASAPRAKP
ncbi:MAG TPA: nodulation protein NodZ [Candidatus Polarisedimenticolia bacterium]|nr:nodulation protein NodZ [Candidatus Polarisedimenticolia bacterium]